LVGRLFWWKEVAQDIGELPAPTCPIGATSRHHELDLVVMTLEQPLQLAALRLDVETPIRVLLVIAAEVDPHAQLLCRSQERFEMAFDDVFADRG
jgi:hypothetical protein